MCVLCGHSTVYNIPRDKRDPGHRAQNGTLSSKFLSRLKIKGFLFVVDEEKTISRGGVGNYFRTYLGEINFECYRLTAVVGLYCI